MRFVYSPICRSVSCFTFVCSQDYPRGFLVSGSGDSTVRLWEYASGSLLHTCEVGAELSLINSGEGEKKVPSASYHNSLSYHGSAVNALRFSPSGKKLMVFS
ncbi:hypothetical protein POM88_044837 [Heracleum sosnowskyi]|uniref:Uncharacterized protein n=1 Tax=Heracleum sosnowskyi TaxID=360622 RepID=A0AAD8M5R7_9APIA|nr:hypothetical protein POM88_044837 [Heracleum sosnowskyi]